MSAPFIMKHLNLGFGAGSRLVVGEDGQLRAEIIWQAQYDVCPTWLRLALNHVEEASRCRDLRLSAWQGTDDEAKARTLQSEFQASIQAVVAAATALDATYASVSKLIQIPADEREAWRRNRKARSAQVSEVLRRAFCIGEDQAKRMREDLKEIYRVRDLAVHPAAEMKPFVSHSEMNVLVEWQFDLYRASKAIMVVAGAGQILWVLAHNTKPTLPAIKNFASNMKIYLQELYPKGEPALPH